MKEEILISTRGGQCPTHVIKPDTSKALPAILFYMDAGGIRPAMIEMAERMAMAGYLVLLPDLFYRFGPYGPFVPTELFKGDVTAVLGPLMATTSNAKAVADTEALLSYLDGRSDVAGKFGAVGFCMGGAMAISAAATHADRFAAVASFHGGNLATDDAQSPHLLVPRLRADVYIASAEGDDLYPPAMARRLEEALSAAGVPYRAETYPGAAHGWMTPDFPVYNEKEAARGWSELFALFERTL